MDINLSLRVSFSEKYFFFRYGQLFKSIQRNSCWPGQQKHLFHHSNHNWWQIKRFDLFDVDPLFPFWLDAGLKNFIGKKIFDILLCWLGIWASPWVYRDSFCLCNFIQKFKQSSSFFRQMINMVQFSLLSSNSLSLICMTKRGFCAQFHLPN